MLTSTKYELGERIRTIRTSRMMSQNELAFRSGLNKATLCRLENGQRIPNATTLYKLADALGVPVTDFVDVEMPVSFHNFDDPGICEITKYLKKLSQNELKDVLLMVKTFYRWRS